MDVAIKAPHGASVHEVGTGSGAIALAIVHERPDLRVTASDISPEAITVARENARRLGVSIEFSVADGVPPGEFDRRALGPAPQSGLSDCPGGLRDTLRDSPRLK